MTACARGGVRFFESRGSRASPQLERTEGGRERERERERGGKAGGGNDRKRARVGSLSRSPWGPARNAHLKRGRNGRGAPGVFLTRIPNVRTCRPPSHPSAPYRSPVAATPAPLVLSPLPFGLSILSWTFFFASSSSLSACLFSALVLARDKNFRWAVSALTCGRSREYGLSGKTEGGGRGGGEGGYTE